MSAIGQDDHNAPGNGQGGNEGGNPFDYERSYNELRPEYTRVTQELSTTRERLSEYESLFEGLHDPDPEVQAAAFEALGLQLDSGSPGTTQQEEFTDPLEEQLSAALERLERLESARELEASAREEIEYEQLRDNFIGEAIGIIEDSLKPQFGDNFKFSEREEQALGNLAISMSDAQGVPDVEGAYNLLYGDQGVLEINRSRWLATKTGAVVPPAGTSIPADKRPMTPRERADYIDQRLAALEQLQ